MKETTKAQKIFPAESCATPHRYQNSQGLLRYRHGLTENTCLRYFLYRIKYIPKIQQN